MSKAEAQKLFKELESNIDELPMHLYILIWTFSEMNERFMKNPANLNFVDICYPHTSVPLFSKIEASNLEELWTKNIAGNEELFPAEHKKQKGGRVPSFADMKKKSAEFGQAMEIGLKALDPKLISPDYLYDYSTELFDSVDSKLTEASGTLGLVALESTMPDPTFIIPTPVPIPVPIPAKAVLPMINAILEAIRITIGIVFTVDPFGIGIMSRSIVTFLMVCLDLGRGNLYHAIFTSFGFIGTTPMFVGIGLKIVRDAIMLISPDIRKDLRDLIFKSTKSFTMGFSIWLFTVLSPKFVKEPLRALFDSVALQIDTVNGQLEAAEDVANKSPIAALATIKMPRIPSDKIPDVNNLYALREAVREPAIYCDPKISSLMNDLREVPPYALFFDLALIPAPGSPEFEEKCAPFKGKGLSDNLVDSAKPQVFALGSDTPLDLDAVDPAAMAAKAAEDAVDKATSSVTGAVDAATEKATSAVDAATEKAGSAVTGAVDAVTDKAASTVTGAVDAVTDKATEAAEKAEAVVRKGVTKSYLNHLNSKK
jgi:hypothetical protein